MSGAIWWVRRDLRTSDNAALAEALASADEVTPVFVLDPALLGSDYAGPRRVGFLSEGLRALNAELRARGSRLIVRHGRPAEALARLAAELGAVSLWAEEDHSPYARRRDALVAAMLPLRLTGSPALRPPGAVLKADGAPYTVYTPFSRRWRELPWPGEPLPAPARIATPEGIESEGLPEEPASAGWPAGEAEGQRRLRAFCEGPEPPIHRYAEERDRMDLEATSQLSPYLRLGMVSAAHAVAAARRALAAAPTAEARRGAEVWLSELIWREFYIHILAHFPHVREASFRPELREIAWANDQEGFDAWREGRTGYPVVDAAMRQLAATGWMHNRARMIAASFLVKDLLVDWRWGERWFMQQLVDGDPAANNGGWQWTAGTGTDAAPYFRVFNPVLQGRRYDPQGAYVRRWVGELANVPDGHIHAPWEMGEAEQRAAGCQIGRDYPAPVVDHAWARARALAAYGRGRAS